MKVIYRMWALKKPNGKLFRSGHGHRAVVTYHTKRSALDDAKFFGDTEVPVRVRVTVEEEK